VDTAATHILRATLSLGLLFWRSRVSRSPLPLGTTYSTYLCQGSELVANAWRYGDINDIVTGLHSIFARTHDAPSPALLFLYMPTTRSLLAVMHGRCREPLCHPERDQPGRLPRPPPSAYSALLTGGRPLPTLF